MEDFLKAKGPLLGRVELEGFLPLSVSFFTHNIDILMISSSVNFCRFIGTMMQDNVVDIFMEYIPGGSLALALKQLVSI